MVRCLARCVMCFFVSTSVESLAQSTTQHPPQPGPVYGQTCAEAHGAGYCCLPNRLDVEGQCGGYSGELICVWEAQRNACPDVMILAQSPAAHPPQPGPVYGQTCADAHGAGYCCLPSRLDVEGQCGGYPDELTCVWEAQRRTCPDSVVLV